MNLPILHSELRFEQDIVAARQRARMLAEELGFESQDQVRIATAVSEIARNAFRYTGSGKIIYSIDQTARGTLFAIEVADTGKGISNLDTVLSGRYQSATGMGMGIVGTQRLMDHFTIDSSEKGTTVRFGKLLPARARKIDAKAIDTITNKLSRERPVDPLSEVQRQNRELMTALDDLRRKQDELAQMNRELEDTNRGVVALYAELDEKADHLRRADELKSKFLSNMSHEFRTPLNSILALSRILLEGVDGPLTDEQSKQIGYIRKAASDLSELVNDLLDLAKVEAGKIVMQPIVFEIESLFGALRGMLRPLLMTESVALTFEAEENIPELYTDEGKVSQILRNLISNALKFTPRGEVRVHAAFNASNDTIAFTVSDTGIGIAPEHLDTIFHEFAQVDSPTQRSVKGTGLGLPLSRQLAGLLGGTLTVESTLGIGSTFTATIPRNLAGREAKKSDVPHAVTVAERTIMIVEDRDDERLVLQKHLISTDFEIFAVSSLAEAKEALHYLVPKVLILDILLQGEDAWKFLREVKGLKDPPYVIVITAIEDQGRAFALGADAYLTKPVEPSELYAELDAFTARSKRDVVLVVDDEEISRYIITQLLEELGFAVIATDNGRAGIDAAIEHKPYFVVLDLVMPGLTGEDVLKRLRADDATKDLKVLLYTSKILSEVELSQLSLLADGILRKDIATREDARAALQAKLESLHVMIPSA